MFSTKPQPDVAQLLETTVKLDALHNAYQVLMEDARSQLEALEMSDEQIKQLAKTLSDEDTPVSQTLAMKSATEIIKQLTDDDDAADYTIRRLVDKITAQVWKRLEDSLKRRIQQEFNRILNSQVIEDAIKFKIDEDARLVEAFASQRALGELVTAIQNAVPPNVVHPQTEQETN